MYKRQVIYGLSPIPQKEVFYDATGGPFTHTKVEFLMELYDKEGIAGVIPCTSLMEAVSYTHLLMQGEFTVAYGSLAAGCVMALVPVLILFAYIQKYLVSGLSSGAVKG